MNKQILRMLAILMIVGLLLVALAPAVVSLMSSNSSEDAQDQSQSIEITPDLLEVSSEEAAD